MSSRSALYKANFLTIVLLAHGFIWFMLNLDAKKSPAAPASSRVDLLLIAIATPQKPRAPAPLAIAAKARTAKQAANPVPKTIRADAAQPQNRRPMPMTTVAEPRQPAPQPQHTGDDLTPGKGLDYAIIAKVARSTSHEMETRPRSVEYKPLTRIEKFEKEVGQAKRGDCRNEYANLGIFAIPLLIKDSLDDKGCKW